jgi:hypothetical protein
LPHLDITLPYIAEPPEFETLIDARTTTLIHQLTSSNTPNGGVRGQIAVQFFDKKRRKSSWLTGIGRANEEEVIWEEWLVEVTIARPKTEGGELFCLKIRLPETVLTCLPSPRKRKGTKSDGKLAAEDGFENSQYCESGQRSHTANHNKRGEPISVQNYAQSEARGLRASLRGLELMSFKHQNIAWRAPVSLDHRTPIGSTFAT